MQKTKRPSTSVCFYVSRGVWVASFYRADGRRRIKQLRSANTKEEAVAEFEALKMLPQEPEPVPGSIAEMQRTFQRQVTSNLKPATQRIFDRMFRVLDRSQIKRSMDIRPDKIPGLIDTLISEGVTNTATQHKTLRAARRFFRWSKLAGFISDVPEIPMPRVKKRSKGRPLTFDEFNRMLKAVDSFYTMHPERAEKCRHFLWGLWEGGLRISEIAELSWDDTFSFHIDCDNYPRPVFVLPDTIDKTGQDRVFPMTPEFWALVSRTPEEERHGPVFSVLYPRTREPRRMIALHAGQLVSRIGRHTQIVVARRIKGGNTVEKYASAHDLRRSFGLRWAQRVNQLQLMALMRHSDPNTTAGYYIGSNAAAMLESVWSTQSGTKPNRQRRDK